MGRWFVWLLCWLFGLVFAVVVLVCGLGCLWVIVVDFLSRVLRVYLFLCGCVVADLVGLIALFCFCCDVVCLAHVVGACWVVCGVWCMGCFDCRFNCWVFGAGCCGWL